MYSGTTLTKYSGRVFGAHQKFDRVAFKHLKKVSDSTNSFPSIKQILHFEGRNGPDGIKSKSPAKDEPWHYYDPFDEDDSQLLEIIEAHYTQLVKELKTGNKERAAFEASWLAHALVDGLTPAHHYPYEEKLTELRGEGIETRTSIKDKIIIPGETVYQMFLKNWAMWGAKGLMMTHGMFEFGVASIVAPLSLITALPHTGELKLVNKIGVIELFKRTAREIALMDMYEDFYRKGWTPKLANSVRRQLAPKIVRTITLAWYAADFEAAKGK
jgi:hypothetical protein